MYDPSALTVSVPYVPVNACPIVPDVPEPLSVPVLIAVIVNEPETSSPSASVSFAKTPLPAVTETLASSLTAPVSLLPTGASFATGALVMTRIKSPFSPFFVPILIVLLPFQIANQSPFPS